MTDDKRLVNVGHLAVGNWSGIQPPGYRGNNSFPRKALMRLVVKELRRRAKQQRWRYSDVIVVPHLVSEFQTSKQAPCLCHRATGEKIDRHNATAEEVGAEKLQDGKATSWKLLTCPRCNIAIDRQHLPLPPITRGACWPRDSIALLLHMLDMHADPTPTFCIKMAADPLAAQSSGAGNSHCKVMPGQPTMCAANNVAHRPHLMGALL